MNENTERYYVTPIAHEYRYYLDDEVGDVQDYHTLFELLANASEQDVVKIIVSNFGGAFHTCVSIVNAIRNTKAHTVGVLASVAYSAGGAVWKSCAENIVESHASFMGHDSQGADFGSSHKRMKSIQHHREVLLDFYKDVYQGFLTEQEIEGLLEDNDLWLKSSEIVERLEKCNAEVNKLIDVVDIVNNFLEEVGGEPELVEGIIVVLQQYLEQTKDESKTN